MDDNGTTAEGSGLFAGAGGLGDKVPQRYLDPRGRNQLRLGNSLRVLVENSNPPCGTECGAPCLSAAAAGPQTAP